MRGTGVFNMANQTAQIIAEENENFEEIRNKYLIFHLNGMLYALHSSQAEEIIAMQQPTYMPKLPPYVLGVINIRGKILPIICLRKRFNIEQVQYDRHTCIIICEFGAESVGLVVDSVDDMADIPDDKINPPPALDKNSNPFISGITTVNDRTVMILDGMRIIQK